MILNKEIVNAIKAKSDLLFDKAGDFAVLSSLIFDETGRTIGVSTLKRLFNYINDDHRTSEYTMNTIALYLGYLSWHDYIVANKIDSDWNFEDDAIYIEDLEIGTFIQVKYLDRVIVFMVDQHEEQKVLRVKSTKNSSLQVDDILFIHKLREGECIEAEKIIRNGTTGNYKTNGELKEIVVNGL